MYPVHSKIMFDQAVPTMKYEFQPRLGLAQRRHGSIEYGAWRSQIVTGFLLSSVNKEWYSRV